MDVTSNHLEFYIPNTSDFNNQGDFGEELSKRGETFGHPVGKGAFCKTFSRA
jgi:DNA-directed RNA polymerase II subunit RPB3